MITYSDFVNSIPILIIAASSLLVMLIEAIFAGDKRTRSKSIIFYFSVAALLTALIFSFVDIPRNVLIYVNFVRVNPLTTILNITLLLGVLITVLSSREYLSREGVNYGEYYSLVFFSLLGMMLMAGANDLITLFVGIELMSVCFYVLSGFMRKKLESNESALKYFLLGAFLTGFLLMGIAFIYGYVGSTNYTAVINAKPSKDNFYVLGLVLVFIAFIFKTGSFPLQMWIPDVYQGSPTVVTGMMSSVGKAAAFGAMLTFFSVFEVKNIPLLIAIVSTLTMLYGNVVALVQTNIKRLLAYSSIAHAGYIMIGFIIINYSSTQAVLFYLISYILMQLGAFIVISIAEERPEHPSDPSLRNTLEGFKGLGKQNPGLAALISVFLFSLAGIPPFAGFWGKYYIFLSAIQNNYLWIAIVGILLSLIGVYYYIRVILYMWFYEPVAVSAKKERSHFAFAAAVISTVGLFAFGIYPEIILRILRTIV